MGWWIVGGGREAGGGVGGGGPKGGGGDRSSQSLPHGQREAHAPVGVVTPQRLHWNYNAKVFHKTP